MLLKDERPASSTKLVDFFYCSRSLLFGGKSIICSELKPGPELIGETLVSYCMLWSSILSKSAEEFFMLKKISLLLRPAVTSCEDVLMVLNMSREAVDSYLLDKYSALLSRT